MDEAKEARARTIESLQGPSMEERKRRRALILADEKRLAAEEKANV